MLAGHDQNDWVGEGNLSQDPYEDETKLRFTVMIRKEPVTVRVEGDLRKGLKLRRGYRVRVHGSLAPRKRSDKSMTLEVLARSIEVEKLYRVGRKEVHTQYFTVRASSPEEARAKIGELDEGIEDERIFSHLLDRSEWTVAEREE